MNTNYTNLRLETVGHTAIVTLTNPPANTWTAAALSDLVRMIDTLNADKHIYSLIITGEGEKFFSAGADLKLFADGDKTVASDMAHRFGLAFETLSQFRGVSIAAINGYAMGGGLECALACDLRIAEQQVQMALPEASVGLLPCGGGTQNLPWLVGEGWAKRMILCGERVDAETALRIGLVEEVVKQGEVKSRALALAQRVDQQSPASISACKRLIQGARTTSPNQVLPLERTLFMTLFETQDQQEGVNAFLQKRAPRWSNS